MRLFPLTLANGWHISLFIGLIFLSVSFQPMNAVLGIGRLLQETHLSTEQQQYVSMINNSGQLLLSIINDVLDLSRIESGKLELERSPFSILECVENSVQLCWTTAHAKRLDLSYEIAPNVPDQVIGDLAHLMQVIINLISNALKFTFSSNDRIGSCHVKVTKEEFIMPQPTNGLIRSSHHGERSLLSNTPLSSGVPVDSSMQPNSVVLKFEVRDTGEEY